MSNRNNKMNRNKKTRNSRCKNKEERKYEDQTNEVTKSFNDVSWYAKNKQLLKDSASFSYNSPLGALLHYQDYDIASNTSISLTAPSIPGIMSFYVVPGIGKSENRSDPANLAAINLYSYVRYNNSGGANYDSPDLMMYVLTMDSLYYMWNWGQRAYGLMQKYDQMNRYMPRALVNASGFDFDDLQQNLADFRQFLNITASKISSYCVPGDMSYVTRHSWMFSNVYKDSSIAKAQMYLWVPAVYYVYNETSGAGKLQHKQIFTQQRQLVKFSDYISMMNEMIAAIDNAEDIGNMSGDILKAFGSSALFKLSAVPEDYSVEPVYNEEVLTQIHNCTVGSAEITLLGSYFYSSTALDITQNVEAGAIVYNPQPLQSFSPFMTLPRMVNFPWESVTPENTMVGTRLTTISKIVIPASSTSAAVMEMTFGTEFVCSGKVWFMNANAQMQSQNFVSSDVATVGSAANYSAQVFRASLVSNFDWHPLVYYGAVNGTGASIAYSFSSIQGDLANYTLMGVNDLFKLHETAILSEFNVPQLQDF